MWKLITSEFKANRFHANGSQYMDQQNPCVTRRVAEEDADAETSAEAEVSLPSGVDSKVEQEGGFQEPRLNPAGLGVPPSCTVCSPTTPCLFDVITGHSKVKKPVIPWQSYVAC